MTKIRTVALALAGILAISATTVTNASAQWRGHPGGRGIGIGAGIAAGALIGSAVAARPYGGYYYDDPGYAYDAPYAYEAAPVNPAPGYYRGGNYGYSKCYTDEGYGRRLACDYGGR